MGCRIASETVRRMPSFAFCSSLRSLDYARAFSGTPTTLMQALMLWSAAASHSKAKKGQEKEKEQDAQLLEASPFWQSLRQVLFLF